MVELLIMKGANVNAQNESGKTAIMLAAFAGKLNIIKELRNNGASYDLKDRAGCTVLHYAVDGGNLDSVIIITITILIKPLSLKVYIKKNF
jgi:ankyrin repeat protein